MIVRSRRRYTFDDNDDLFDDDEILDHEKSQEAADAMKEAAAGKNNDDISDNDLQVDIIEEYLDEPEDEDEEEEESFEVRKEIKKNKKSLLKGLIYLCAAIAIIVGVLCAVIIIQKNTPSDEHVNLVKYYGTTNDAVDAVVVVDTSITDHRAVQRNGIWYLDYDFVRDSLSDKIYYDQYNNNLLYTNATKIYTIAFDSSTYNCGELVENEDYIIAYKEGDKVYIAVDFIKERADFIYTTANEPLRFIITTKYGTYSAATFDEDAKIRTGKSIKDSIISDADVDTSVWWISDPTQEGEWTYVLTADGRNGYVKTSDIDKTSEFTVSNDGFVPETFESISKNYKINLVWHAVYSADDNSKIKDLLGNTTGVTTVSPTWYKVTGSDGSISSYANKDYVDYIHEQGMEIWPLISDFTSVNEEGGWDELGLLSHTDSRSKLISNIMSEIKTYDYDGINIDFEKVSDKMGDHYTQFIRELSIECRKAGVVLSIDNYVPKTYNTHYNRAAQGECADYVIVMGYDEHYAGGKEAGSVSSITWVEEGIKNTLEDVHSNKVINALPFYTRLWSEGQNADGTTFLESKSYSMDGAVDIIKELNLQSEWDDTVKQYVARGTDGKVNYSIWLEDARSMEEKLKVVKDSGIAGVAGWCLGMESKNVWDLIGQYNK